MRPGVVCFEGEVPYIPTELRLQCVVIREEVVGHVVLVLVRNALRSEPPVNVWVWIRRIKIGMLVPVGGMSFQESGTGSAGSQ